LVIALTSEERFRAAEEHGNTIRVIVTNAATVIPELLLERLPNLGLMAMIGVGTDGIAFEAIRSRGIIVTNCPGTSAETVADHALALMLAALREIPSYDAAVRRGEWRRAESLSPIASGKRVGILGLGDIGSRIAQRCAAFNMKVVYHNRKPRQDVGWSYAESVRALAEMSDVLITTLPDEPKTKHLISRSELAALGPNGFLVNVGRGSVVDTEALLDALDEGLLCGAALDVVEGEPEIPSRLLATSKLILTPHVGGRSPEAAAATIDLVIANIHAFLTNQPVLTRIL